MEQREVRNVREGVVRMYKPREDIRDNVDGKNAPRNERCTLYEAFIRSKNGIGLRRVAGRRHGRTTWIFITVGCYVSCCCFLFITIALALHA